MAAMVTPSVLGSCCVQEGFGCGVRDLAFNAGGPACERQKLGLAFRDKAFALGLEFAFWGRRSKNQAELNLTVSWSKFRRKIAGSCNNSGGRHFPQWHHKTSVGQQDASTLT